MENFSGFKKERIDNLLVLRGFFESREKAQRAIMAGLVFVNGKRVNKASEKVPENADIEIRGNACPYVSRGGLKLKKAIDEFKISLLGKVCLDVGASTGGFTDCMLREGAFKVYAVDVGYGQFHWSLRNDPRVVLIERFNARYLNKEVVPEDVDFFAMDLSFISVKKVLPAVKGVLKESCGEGIVLVKPQFEAGRENVKGGVVKDKKIHLNVIEDIISFVKEKLGFYPLGLTYSPIKGPEGNIEFLLYIGFKEKENCFRKEMVLSVVESAHAVLGD
ncbi:MAG: TlyA family RNA methyltransferase [Synergistetes bacterium]|nr:TlyA family RNA methyltransferase [Synergistota bacterium]MCX8127564.1 TlyA family RNA methyltransferase [Synergistota bacterium]MDW8191519.1 TlyA family RNA methyltransferase [Synergistota bacterium]